MGFFDRRKEKKRLENNQRHLADMDEDEFWESIEKMDYDPDEVEATKARFTEEMKEVNEWKKVEEEKKRLEEESKKKAEETEEQIVVSVSHSQYESVDCDTIQTREYSCRKKSIVPRDHPAWNVAPHPLDYERERNKRGTHDFPYKNIKEITPFEEFAFLQDYHDTPWTYGLTIGDLLWYGSGESFNIEWNEDLVDKSEPAEPHSMNDAKKDDLKAFAKSHGLLVGGNKPELIQRISENIPVDEIAKEFPPKNYVLKKQYRGPYETFSKRKAEFDRFVKGVPFALVDPTDYTEYLAFVHPVGDIGQHFIDFFHSVYCDSMEYGHYYLATMAAFGLSGIYSIRQEYELAAMLENLGLLALASYHIEECESRYFKERPYFHMIESIDDTPFASFRSVYKGDDALGAWNGYMRDNLGKYGTWGDRYIQTFIENISKPGWNGRFDM